MSTIGVVDAQILEAMGQDVNACLEVRNKTRQYFLMTDELSNSSLFAEQGEHKIP